MMTDEHEQRAAVERTLRDAGVVGLSDNQMSQAIDGVLAQVEPRRTWVGEAKAAFDQSITEVKGFPGADFWVARAQAAAAIASAEQARVGNLIAWKALQTQRQSAPDNGIDLLPLGGDEITQQIEEGLGFA